MEGRLVGGGSPHSLWSLSVPRFVAYVWWFFTREADEKDREKFRARLWVPPKSLQDAPIPAESPWSPENENRAFEAFRAQSGL